MDENEKSETGAALGRLGELLRVSEVAKRLSLSVSKVYQLLETGRLAHYRLDGAIRVSNEQLADYLETAKRQGTADERRTPQCPRPPVRLRHL